MALVPPKYAILQKKKDKKLILVKKITTKQINTVKTSHKPIVTQQPKFLPPPFKRTPYINQFLPSLKYDQLLHGGTFSPSYTL